MLSAPANLHGNGWQKPTKILWALKQGSEYGVKWWMLQRVVQTIFLQ